MDLQDIFENKRKHHHKYPHQNYYPDDRYSQSSYSGSSEKLNLPGLLKSIKNNKRLRTIILLLILIILAVVIGLVLLFLPILINLFNYVYQNGVSGVIDKIMEFLNTLWTGA